MSVASLVAADRDAYALTVLLIKLLIWCWLLSQDAPQSHSSQRQISRQVGISLMSVNRIIKNDLQLKCHKKRRAHELRQSVLIVVENCWDGTQLERKTSSGSPTKNFSPWQHQVGPNTQNDRVYVPDGVRKKNIAPSRLLRCRPTFSSSLTVSVGVSALGRTDLHFIDAGVKINGQYYREVLLMQKLLHDIKEFSDYFIFQQDSAPAHHANRRLIWSSARHQTSSRRHFGLQIVQTSTRSITRYGTFFSSGFAAGKSKMWTSCDSASLRSGNAWTQSNSGVDVFAFVWLRREDISSKCYNVPIRQYLFNCVATLKFYFCQMWYDF